MSQTYETRQVRYGYADQADFDTVAVDGAAVAEVTCDPFDIDPDVMIHELPHVHGTRQPVENTTVHTTQGSSAKFSVSGPVDLNDIDQYAYAHFQKVIEGADTEFTKTFTYFSTHPDFGANAGHFLTWIKRLPVASTSQKAMGCIAPRFKLSAERDGMLMYETDWVALGTTIDTSNPSGTWTDRDGSGFLYFNDIASATLTHGAAMASPTAITMQSFEVEGAYETEKVGHSVTNGFEEHGIKGRSGTFKIKFLRDSTADEALESLKEGEMVKFDVDFGTLTISVTGKIESMEYDKEGLLISQITCRMLSSYAAGVVGECLTVVVQNTIDRSWPAA
ncbi:MAG: hypothetical protein WC052_04640 [Patescibacteria group bacterium]|jgi:hypothetical protein